MRFAALFQSFKTFKQFKSLKNALHACKTFLYHVKSFC